MVQVRILAAERGADPTARPDNDDADGGVPLPDEVESLNTGAMPGYAEISEAWLLGRTRELVAVTQRSEPEAQREYLAELDDLLDECKRRAEPIVVGQMLRSAIQVRLEIPDHPSEEIDSIIDELLVHARRHQLVVLEAGAHALRAKQILLGLGNPGTAGADLAGVVGSMTGKASPLDQRPGDIGKAATVSTIEDAAVAEVARALAMLDDDTGDRTRDHRGWQRMLSGVLVDIALILTELGVHEEANHVMARADVAVQFGGGPHEIAIHLINRVRIQLHWALRLERVGDTRGAAEKIATGSAMANATEMPFRESLFPRDPKRAAADQIPELGAAHALANPGPEHIDRLRELIGSTRKTGQLIIVTIALARSLAAADQTEEALEYLGYVRDALFDQPSEQVLRLSLTREIARLAEADRDADPELKVSALQAYVAELESELWGIRGSRIATLNARREHDRLSREHGAIAEQAMQDPLTGLPNRRALDERLNKLVNEPVTQPVAIALVDLDGFKGVNDQASHAEGDDVLRVVASTLRGALRGDDLVARYGGDEFVALLPGAPLSAAEAALNRAATAVAELPQDISHGVTLSVGVVGLRPHETAASVLARADAAMYVAKRSGGNAVAAVSGSTAPGAVTSGNLTGMLTGEFGHVDRDMDDIRDENTETGTITTGISHTTGTGPAWVPPGAP
jgi:diguanylate cyclase (GGDEF)-like protein